MTQCKLQTGENKKFASVFYTPEDLRLLSFFFSYTFFFFSLSEYNLLADMELRL